MRVRIGFPRLRRRSDWLRRRNIAHRLDKRLQPSVIDTALGWPFSPGGNRPDRHEAASEVALWNLSWPIPDEMPEQSECERTDLKAPAIRCEIVWYRDTVRRYE